MRFLTRQFSPVIKSRIVVDTSECSIPCRAAVRTPDDGVRVSAVITSDNQLSANGLTAQWRRRRAKRGTRHQLLSAAQLLGADVEREKFQKNYTIRYEQNLRFYSTVDAKRPGCCVRACVRAARVLYNVLHSYRDEPGANARIYKVFDNGLHVGRRLWRVSHARPSGSAYGTLVGPVTPVDRSKSPSAVLSTVLVLTVGFARGIGRRERDANGRPIELLRAPRAATVRFS